jgi:heptosyltransferase-2
VPARPLRFLIVRIAALGDVAVMTTVVTRIRTQHPDAHVTWLCGESTEPLVRLLPGIDDVIVVRDRRLYASGGGLAMRGVELARVWARLLARRFDRVVVGHAHGGYRALVWATWPARVSALSHDPDHPNPLPSRFRGDEYARLLQDDVDALPITRRYEMADLRSVIAPVTGHGRRRVVLVPGGARNVLRDDAVRRWPVEHFRDIAARLVREDCEVVLLGDARDAVLRPHFAGLAVTDCLGVLDIPQALATLRGADVVVTGDTGPLHLARLVRTPVVALFGPSDPRQMVGDSDPGVHVLWGGAHLPCRPCYDGKEFPPCRNNLCMKSISVDAAFRAVMSVLESTPPVPV